MKNTQKGFVAPIIIIVAVLVVGAGAYYLYSTKSPTHSSQTPSVSAIDASSSPTATSDKVSAVPSVAWNAKIVGGKLSEYDRENIISTAMKLVSIISTNDVTTFRQYAASFVTPTQLTQLDKTSDGQVSAFMKLIAPAFSKEVTVISLSSPEAVWTISDKDHVKIDIQTSAHSSVTINLNRVNGVWY